MTMARRKTLNCHKCPHSGTDKCIECKRTDEDVTRTPHIIDGYEPPQRDTSGSEQVTNLPDEVENKLRVFMF